MNFVKTMLSDLGDEVRIEKMKGLTTFKVMLKNDCIFIVDKYDSGDIEISTNREKVLLTEDTLKRLLIIYDEFKKLPMDKNRHK